MHKNPYGMNKNSLYKTMPFLNILFHSIPFLFSFLFLRFSSIFRKGFFTNSLKTSRKAPASVENYLPYSLYIKEYLMA